MNEFNKGDIIEYKDRERTLIVEYNKLECDWYFSGKVIYSDFPKWEKGDYETKWSNDIPWKLLKYYNTPLMRKLEGLK